MKGELFVSCPGGSLEVGPLRELARFANQKHAEAIRITHRQGLALRFPKRGKIPDRLPESTRRLSSMQENIMSSAMFYNPEKSRSWLSESHILEIVRDLSKKQSSSELSIAVLERSDPLFSLQENRISFVASPLAEHWEVHWTWREKLESLPALAPGRILPEITEFLGNAILSHRAGSPLESDSPSMQLLRQFSSSLLPKDLSENTSSKNPWNNSAGNPLADTKALLAELCNPSLSYIEGFREVKESYELGIFRSDHNFTPLFLDELGHLCRKSRIGRIYLSPMHSFYIKNIPKDSLPDWRALLIRHGINLRHNQVELSFRMEHADLPFYHYLSARLQKIEGHCHGQIYGICRSQSPLFGDFCIRIRKGMLWREYELYKKIPALSEAASPYLCLGDFSKRRHLLQALLEAAQKSERAFLAQTNKGKSKTQKESEKAEHGFRCKDCGFVYERAYGDPLSRIPAGTPFESLPQSYACPICGNSGDGFLPHAFFRKPLSATSEISIENL